MLTPVSMASDGTALKPRLEYDSFQKKMVGTAIDIDPKYLETHPEPP